MIRPINITLNAAHPELPFAEATTFTGSPSTVFIRGVPKAVGNWSITAVQVAVIFPDNSTTTREAVESAEGVWVATIPGTTTSGRTESGFRILASGIDENGATVTGYVLGFADFSVFSLIPLPTPDAPYYYLRYFESVPASPHKGDVCYLDGVLKWYDGTAWQPIAGAPVVAPSTDPSDAGKSADAYATGTALAGKASKSDLDPLLFAQYYPDGSVKSAAEFTQGIKYDAPDTTHRTITVKPFRNTGDSADDNSSLVGRVVIPPFVDGDGNPYITDDGMRFKVVGVSGDATPPANNTNLTAVIAPSTVTNIGNAAFYSCTALTTVSLPAATTIVISAFAACTSLTTVSLPAATTIGNGAFGNCTSLTTVSLPAATSIGAYAFFGAPLASVDFGDTPRSSVPSLGADAIDGAPTSCKIIVPYTQYDAWIAAENWRDLPQEFVRHAEKADKPATFTAGNLAALDSQGNPTDSAIPAENVAVKADLPYSFNTATVYVATASHVEIFDLADRASNRATLGSTVTAANVTLPAATTGKMRDFYIRLIIQSSAAPTITFYDPATQATVTSADIPFGASSLADIAPGDNLILFTEIEANKWLVSVKHEEAAS